MLPFNDYEGIMFNLLALKVAFVKLLFHSQRLGKGPLTREDTPQIDWS
jgi:hypothetical protein